MKLRSTLFAAVLATTATLSIGAARAEADLTGKRVIFVACGPSNPWCKTFNDRVVGLLKESLRPPRAFTDEHRIVANGVERWLLVRTEPQFSADGHFVGLVGSVLDTSAERFAAIADSSSADFAFSVTAEAASSRISVISYSTSSA